MTPRYGPWAVVTGASDGIGEQFAWALAREGYGLLLVARGTARLDAVAARIRAECSSEVQVCAADLSTDGGVEAVLSAAAERNVGMLVASAGFGTAGEFLELPLSNELDMLAVNCRAPTVLAHAFARRFAERGSGAIVLISSILGFAGVPRMATYAATKAYIQSLAEGLHDELAPHGIAVLAVAPGPTRSGFAARARITMSATVDPSVVAKESLAALGRWAVVRPGGLTKLLDGSLRLVPRRLRSRILAQVARGMLRSPNTGH